MAAPPEVALDVRDWPRFHPTHKHPLWWGILALIAIETTVVACFITSYFYLRLVTPDWPPPGAGAEALPLFWPTVEVGLLLASAGAMYGSTQAINKNLNVQAAFALTLALALDCAVLATRWQQLDVLPFRWDDHAYGSAVWLLSGFHFVHVASAVIGTSLVWLLALLRYWTPQRQLGSTIDAMYWYFVSFIWIPIYFTIYWTPRVSG